MADFLDTLFRPMDLALIYKPGEAKKRLQQDLERASDALMIAEAFVDDIETLRGYRSKVDEIVHMLSLTDTVISNVRSAIKIYGAVSDLRGNIRNNPEKAAKAFGRLFSGIGELAQYMPFPISSYLGIFKDAENFFENVRQNTRPMAQKTDPISREAAEGGIP